MFCSQCGKEMPDKNTFCTNCGAPLMQPTIQSADQAEHIEVEQAPVEQPAAAPVTETAAPAPETAAPVTEATVAAAGASVAAAAAAAFGTPTSASAPTSTRI